MRRSDVVACLLLVACCRGDQLKVAYLHHGLPVGGIETSIVNTCAHLDRERIEAVVVLFGVDGSAMNALRLDAERANCTVVRFPARSRSADGSIAWNREERRRLVEYLREERFDVGFTYYGGGDLPSEPVPLGVSVAHEAGLAVLVNIAWRTTAPDGWPIQGLEVNTPFVARLQYHAGVEYPIHLAGAGVPVSPAAPRRKERTRTLVVGRLSRVVAAKDPYSFVLAAKVVQDAIANGELPGYDEARFLLGGLGPDLAPAKELAAQVGAKVEFVGYVPAEARDEFFASLDIFLYSTTCDSFGYVVAEAMAAGLPTIATRICSMEDIIQDEVSGLLVDPTLDGEDPEKFLLGDESARRHAEAVMKLARSSEATVAALGENGRRVIQRSWEIRKYCDRHASNLEHVFFDKNRARITRDWKKNAASATRRVVLEVTGGDNHGGVAAIML